MEENVKGYWGDPTSTLDWCEANYEVTYWIAEFWNTISNLFMIVPPFIGAVLGWKDEIEFRYVMSYISLIAVGTGSWLFHGTLLYECQLLDELPMIWGSAILIYCLKEARIPPNQTNIGMIVLLTAYCGIVTIVYVTINKPVFHETAYALMVFTMIYYCVKIVRHNKNLLYLWILSMLIYGTGFLIWNLDNVYCGKFRSIRNTVGYPLKPLFQGHAWWHVFAGIGTYVSIVFSLNARVSFLKQDNKLYMSMGLPTVIRVRPKGH